MRIVPSFDELKNGLARFGWSVEGGAVEQLAVASALFTCRLG